MDNTAGFTDAHVIRDRYITLEPFFLLDSVHSIVHDNLDCRKMCVCMHAQHVCVCVRKCVCVCVHAHVCVCAHMRVCARVRVRARWVAKNLEILRDSLLWV